MKSRLFQIALALAFLFSAPPSSAQDLGDFMPASPVTSGGYQESPGDAVAMMYYKYSRQNPPFERWAEHSPALRNVDPFEKEMLRQREIAQLRQQYDMFPARQTITIRRPVSISQYSVTQKGFFIDSFDPYTFFGFSYMGDDFAVVIPTLLNHQWLVAEDETAMRIDQAAGEDRLLDLVMQVNVTYAEAKPAQLEPDKDYYLMSARIESMSLRDPRTDAPLWEKAAIPAVQNRRQELLDLYR